MFTKFFTNSPATCLVALTLVISAYFLFRKQVTRSPASRSAYHEFTVKCKRCGEIIQARINLNNDPSIEYDNRGKPFYVCRKVLVGSGHCYQQVEVFFKFDENRGVLEKKIVGGEFVEE